MHFVESCATCQQRIMSTNVENNAAVESNKISSPSDKMKTKKFPLHKHAI